MDSGTRTSTTTEPARKEASATPLMVARVMLLLTGAVTLVGAVYFTLFASAEDGGVSTARDWVVAVAALALAVAYLVAALRLARHPSPRAVGVSAALVVAHIVFGMVKLIGYDETESVPFFVADLIILACLALSRRRR
jgi:FtsH-binding integral membrane protein